MAKSTMKRRASKPAKTLPDGFPLWKHPSGRWCKKVRGRAHYFGKVADDPDGQAALARWLDQKDDLLAGRTPRVAGDGLTVRDLANRFLTAKTALLNTGELAQRSFADYVRTCERVCRVFGKARLVADLAADDFERLRADSAHNCGPVTLANEVGRVRVLFKYAHDSGLIDQPIRYGTGFTKPSKKTLRKARAAAGPRMFEAEELRKIIGASKQPLRAMILLAANCGFGQSDIANLPKSALNLDKGWVDYPRPKTGVERRCSLWPETIKAVKEIFENRPKAADDRDDGLVFLTRQGRRWVRTKQTANGKIASMDAVAQEFRKVLNSLDINGKRAFYSIRHGFQTVGEESLDLPAVRSIMGHVDDSMSATYRERIGDDRLRKVTDHVRKWVFSKGAKK